MNETVRLVVFRIDEQRYALPLDTVERIVRAAAATLLPHAPAIVLGVIDVQGRLLPLLDLRHRFGLPQREIRPGDHFLIAHMTRRSVALLVDEAQEVIERADAEIVAAARIVPGLEQIQGVARLADGLVLIFDLESALSLDEAQVLDEALREEMERDA